MSNELEMMNIFLCVVDCGRYDRFQNRETASFINSLADSGMKFTNAISPYNQTQSAMASMFTGLLPSEHLMQSHRDDRFGVGLEKPTLAEKLKEFGYTTIGASAMYWMHPMFGWARGFDHFACTAAVGEDGGVSCYNMFSEIAGTLKPPFFLYMQVGDVHIPYSYPKAFKEEFDNEYDASLKYLDLQLRAIHAELPENTAIVITADHGVGLGEHDGNAWGQGPNSWLYDEIIHVPTIIYNTGKDNKVIDDMFNTKDLYDLLVNGKLLLGDYTISESYAYHHSSCIHKNLNDVGRERCMKGYRCIVGREHKLIESEDGEFFFFNRKDEDTQINDPDPLLISELKDSLAAGSSMNLKDRRQDIAKRRMEEELHNISKGNN